MNEYVRVCLSKLRRIFNVEDWERTPTHKQAWGMISGGIEIEIEI